VKRPDLLEATFSGVLTGEDWIKEEVPDFKFQDRINLCYKMNYKYYISIDGNVSPFMRG
jgi:hypothetical protein